MSVEIDALEVDYGAVKALRGFSLSVKPGESVVLTGRSGCGKSTVLRALAGLLGEDATARGACVVGGLDTLAAPVELPRTVGYVPQNPAHALFCTTVREEVAAGPRHLGLDDPRGRAQGAMAAMGCEGLADRPVRELSSGQQQRVAIAAALAAGPRVLLMDEPTSYLDRTGLEALREALGRLRAQGVTLLIAEHRLDRLPEDLDRLVEMADGAGVGDGPFRPGSVGRFEPPAQEAVGEPVIRAEGLGVEYDGRPILNGVDLTVRAGERLALLGDNGVGKTTLARALAGLLRPTRGRVTNGQGRRISPGMDVGLTTPSPTESLFCDSVQDEIGFGPANFGIPAPGRDLWRGMRLEGLEARRPTALSLGQQQRVSVAAAVAVAPRLVILDEPTVGQDADALRGLFAGLTALAQRGVATLIVTHDSAVAEAFASRILRLEGGMLKG
ncbi:MAG: ABC transporter ATP-binding protein [Fimbriimonas sp.]